MCIYIYIYASMHVFTQTYTLLPNHSIGPMNKTTVDFWYLVWQERPPTIVMVTNFKEGKKIKCQQYWPESDSSQSYGPFKVTLTDQQVYTDYTIRTLQLEVRNGYPMTIKIKCPLYCIVTWELRISSQNHTVSFYILA